MKEKITEYTNKALSKVKDNKTVEKAVNFYKSQSDKKKNIFKFTVLGVVVFSLAVTIFLNISGNAYKVLYPGISDKESAEVLAALQNMKVSAKLNSSGQVMVPAKDYDKLLLDLTSQGYPKSAPAYGIFKDNSTFSQTEWEKKQYLIFNLQEKITKTLKGIEGVADAEVNIVVPEDNGYVLQNNKTIAKASVSVSMRPGYKLSTERVKAIQNLVSYSVPNMEASNVRVVDKKTGITMRGVESDSSNSSESNLSNQFDNLGFQDEVERRINQKVTNILSSTFNEADIRVSSTAQIDYDKMITEQVDYKPTENGAGVKNKFEENIQGAPRPNGAGNVVGQQNNTEVPSYQVPNRENAQNYSQKAEYLVSYIKSQIEKDKAVLKNASVSVAVPNTNLTDEMRENFVDAIAKATNVKADDISLVGVPKSSSKGNGIFNNIPLLNDPINLAIVGVGVLALFVALLFLLKKRKRKKLIASGENINITIDENTKQKEMASIMSLSHNSSSPVFDEVKKFASENPDIAASLIRNWLKEDDK